MLDRIVDNCKEYGMEINAKKTKTIHIGRDTMTLTITVGNAVLEQVSKYPYLGHMITEDVATLKEVQIRIEKTRQKFWKEWTGKAMMEQGGRCKVMVMVDKLWRYETECREQRRMGRHGCQPSDQRRHLIKVRK
ncbi:endonuclease-reverse transcriptase [Elysia marginata]|uniref:Endonuclease-reverse transcriptase n=1 Tax=Elysia marginata TaxID=1093978 RepID=A0AAV4EL83_9GAST|nr:endonuclease-reverse transcriptase [Elysia marginata]